MNAVAAAAAAATTSITVTLLVAFNSQNLPFNVCDWYGSFNNPIQIMTHKQIGLLLFKLLVVVVLFYLILIHPLVLE